MKNPGGPAEGGDAAVGSGDKGDEEAFMITMIVTLVLLCLLLTLTLTLLLTLLLTLTPNP